MESVENRQQEVWKIINRLKTQPEIRRTNIDPGIFSRYFLENSVDTVSKTERDFLKNLRKVKIETYESFFLKPTTPKELIRISVNSKGKNTKDTYGISINMITKIHVIAEHLAFVINGCFESCCFPN
ncbi:hypothetical protein WA026_022607 [Henosepilachna vigintioctopunctata]|uniref:Uncharacterized protein n=1 Tax=Henosepilachna vigintioctopunctata TaxID=420089 RepID=A0AAW1V1W4_9CUCU